VDIGTHVRAVEQQWSKSVMTHFGERVFMRG